jgi:ketosteroid isomerase-like protein
MKTFAIFIFGIIILSSCNNRETFKQEDYQQIIIKEPNLTPTVDIKDFTLISNNLKQDSIDAIEILKVKRNLPLAMQMKNKALFESILSKNFTYRGEDEFYKNSQDYIQNRINATWTIDTVRFQNLTLQFFGETAVLTYRNTLKGTDDYGKSDIENYDWADIYVNENGKWKIGAIHEIESRITYPN